MAKRTNWLKQFKSEHNVFFVILIAFAVISFWRGVWGLMDEYLFPTNYQLSLWSSVIIAVVILYATKHLAKELI